MRKKKPGAKIGRPKGSGKGLETTVGVRLPNRILALLDVSAKALGVTRAARVRILVERWEARRLRRSRRKLLAVLAARSKMMLTVEGTTDA